MPQAGGLRITSKKHAVFSHLSCPKFLKILSRYTYWMLDKVYHYCYCEDKEMLSIPGAGHGEASWEDPELYWSTVETFLVKYIG